MHLQSSSKSKVNIYLDISHPAYAHALMPFMRVMQAKNHRLLISARDKDLTQSLLKHNGFEYINRGKGRRSLAGKIYDCLVQLKRLYPVIRQFKPDIVVSYSSYIAALLGKLLGKPVLTFEDTEKVSLLHLCNRALSSYMITPACFESDFGVKHLRFAGYKELAALHPSSFNVSSAAIPGGQYFVLRFVSWQAWHDRGHRGVSPEKKKDIVNLLSKHGKVYISSENPMHEHRTEQQLPVPPERMHDLIAGASLFFGESASMAAEAAVLGVPAIYIDNTGRGYTRELEQKFGLVSNFGEADAEVSKAIQKAEMLITRPGLKQEMMKKRQIMLDEKIDVTAFMVWFVGNYPESVKIMKENPANQYRFK